MQQTTDGRTFTPTNINTLFYTFDLGCSAALISAGFQLISLDKANQTSYLGTNWGFPRWKIQKVTLMKLESNGNSAQVR